MRSSRLEALLEDATVVGYECCVKKEAGRGSGGGSSQAACMQVG